MEVGVFLILSFFLGGLLSIPFLWCGIGGADAGPASLLAGIGQEVSLLAGTLLSAWMLARLCKWPFPQLRLSDFGRWRDGLWGLGVATGLYAAGFGLSWLLGAVEVVAVSFRPDMLLTNLLLFLLVALFEEILVRKFVLGRLLDGGVSPWVALLLSASLFSLLHLLNPDFAWIPFLNILLAGILLGIPYLYTRSLCCPVLLHWFWNWWQGPVLGYSVSGGNYGASLLTLRLSEENLLNGGGFGFEGSLLCSGLVLVACFLLHRVFSRTSCR